MFTKLHLNTRRVKRTRHSYANLYSRVCITFGILPAFLVFRWGYVNTEKVLYCFHQIILKTMCNWYELYCKLVKWAFTLSNNALLFSHVLCNYLITLEKCPKLYFPSCMEKKNFREWSTPLKFISREFLTLFFGWNLDRILPDNQANKQWRGTFSFYFFQKFWLF